MATYRQMCRKAKKLGHDLTPTLKDELRMLATVSDKDLMVAHVASSFQVTRALAEARIDLLQKEGGQ